MYCCDMMKRNISCELSEDVGDITIFYSKRFDEYMIPVSDNGNSGICITYCPWCGQKLPESKRESMSWLQESIQHFLIRSLTIRRLRKV